MILVLFFCACIIIITTIIEVLIFSTLKIKIEYKKVKLLIYLFNKIPILKISFDFAKIKQLSKKVNVKRKIMINKTMIEAIKTLSPKIEKLDLKLTIKLEDAVYTAFTTSLISIAISTILPFLVKTENSKQIHYEVIPIYNR